MKHGQYTLFSAVAKIAVIFVFFLLAGCQLLDHYDQEVWDAHRQHNESLQNWRIFAEVKFILPKSANHRSDLRDGRTGVLAISWLQKEDVFDIYFINPGRRKASAQLLGKPTVAELVIFEPLYINGQEDITAKERHKGTDADKLMKHLMMLPVSDLVYWLRGLPNPGLDGQSGVNFISVKKTG